MKRPNIWAILAVTSLLSACASAEWSTEPTPARYGMTKSQVREAMGSPYRMETDAQGNEVWYFERGISTDDDGTERTKELSVTFMFGRVSGFGDTVTTTRTTTTTSPN